jgi:hypothetical protein
MLQAELEPVSWAADMEPLKHDHRDRSDDDQDQQNEERPLRKPRPIDAGARFGETRIQIQRGHAAAPSRRLARACNAAA